MTGGVRVTGGLPAARAEVDVEALLAAAAALLAAAERIGHLAVEAGAHAVAPAVLATAPSCPGEFRRSQAALLGLAGPAGAAGVAARLSATAAALAGCAAAYRATELAVLAGQRAVGLLAGRAVLPVVLAGGSAVLLADVVWRGGAAGTGLLLQVAGAAQDGGARPAGVLPAVGALPGEVAAAVSADVRRAADPVADWLASHPGAVGALVLLTPAAVEGALSSAAGLPPVVAAATGGDWPLHDARDAARVLVGVGALTPVLRETAVHVSRATAGPGAPSRPPRGVAEVVDGVVRQAAGRHPTADARGYPGRSPTGGTPPAPGQVRVEGITDAGGRRSWVVLVPGTQEWSPVTGDGRPVMDLTANVHSVAGHRTAPMNLVLEAMRASGVRRGEPVLLAGHSQGGLTVAELAADPAVRAEFTVTHVVTAGSPVGLAEVPEDVQVLSLEHTEDIVPVLDGTANPDSASWTTVQRDLAEDPRWGRRVREDGLAAHESLSYVDTAELVDASDDPALRRWRESAAVFWDRPGARVHVQDFRGERRVAP